MMTKAAGASLLIWIMTWMLAVASGQELGFGTETTGGLAGRVIKVTTLADGGPGSLRAAIRAEGPRVVVFEVGGVIRLKSKLEIVSPYLTIAGQTAPSPGISIAGAGIVIKSHDVVVEHLRFRIGDGPGPDPENRDGVAIDGARDGGRPVHHVVIDNCSISWAVDEGLQIYRDGVHDVTVRDSIIAANLSRSIHPKGAHSMGLLVGHGARRVAIIGNLFAHNAFRNPAIEGGGEALIANNLIYNYQHRAVQFYGGGGGRPAFAAVVGNVALAGPNHTKDVLVFVPRNANPGTALYLADNRGTAGDQPATYFQSQLEGGVALLDQAPLWPDDFSPMKTDEVEDSVLGRAGAWPMRRDAYDQSLIEEVQNRTGRIIDRPPADMLKVKETRHHLEPPAVEGGAAGEEQLAKWLAGFRLQVEGDS